MIPLVAIVALLALAITGHGDALPCEPNTCTPAQLEAEARNGLAVDVDPAVTTEKPRRGRIILGPLEVEQ